MNLLAIACLGFAVCAYSFWALVRELQLDHPPMSRWKEEFWMFAVIASMALWLPTLVGFLRL